MRLRVERLRKLERRPSRRLPNPESLIPQLSLQAFHDSLPLAGHEDENLSHFARQGAGTAEVESNSQLVIDQSRGTAAFARRVFFAVRSLHRLALAASDDPLVGAEGICKSDQDQHDTTALLLDGDRERLERPIVQRVFP